MGWITSHAVEKPTGDRSSRVTTLCKNKLYLNALYRRISITLNMKISTSSRMSRSVSGAPASTASSSRSRNDRLIALN